MKRKNSYIELLRFIMCLVILVHHSGFVRAVDSSIILPFGALAADFFFMITGYFAYAHFTKSEQKSEDKNCISMKYWMGYTINKLKRVFPYAAFGIIIIYALEFFRPAIETPLPERFIKLQNIFFELTVMPMSGVMPIDMMSYRNSPLWFLSAMLIALPILMYLISRYKDLFTGYIVWILPALIYAWMTVKLNGICSWTEYSGFLYGGVIRAFADMMVGCAIYIAAKAIEERADSIGMTGRVLITALELLLLCIALFEFNRILSSYDQIFVIYVMAVMLAITLSNVSLTAKIDNKFINYLGSLSMPVYCLHWGVYQYVARGMLRIKLSYVQGVMITLIICIVVAVVMKTVLNKISIKKANA